MKSEYILKGLHCPNCSAKIEKEVGELEGVRAAYVNLLKETITVEAQTDNLLDSIEKIVHNHEPDVKVYKKEHTHKHEETVSKCDCEHQHENGTNELSKIITGAVIYFFGIILSQFTHMREMLILIIFILAYIILGTKVVMSAIRNISGGHVLDENFLMTVSSIAAFLTGNHSEAVAVMLFYGVGEYFQDMAVSKSRKSISELMDICADTANIIRDGITKTVACEEVNIGELVLVKPGEKIPLDGIVRTGSTEIDTSALTGEAKPQSITEGREVLSGCINKSSVITVEVTKRFEESTAAKIIDMVENAANKKAPAENFITSFSRYYTPLVVAAAVLIAVIPSLFFGNWAEWIRRGCVFLVVSCPCALVISIPLTFFGGIGAASKKGILIKGGNYLEALSKTKTVVFDKTGTLTEGIFGVSKVICKNGYSESEVIELAVKAESFSNHPVARSVVELAKNVENTDILNAEELAGYGVVAKTESFSIIVGNEKLMKKNDIACFGTSETGTVIYVAKDKECIGYIEISDKIKADSQKTISRLKEIGVLKTIMLTGDNEKIAKSVSDSIGIDEYFAELLPDEKVKIFEDISKESDGATVFLGDGINDAPVLARADVGVAMGGIGTDAAIEAADMVIMNDEPSKIVEAINISKKTRRIVIQNIVFALSIKGLFLVLGAFGVAGMWEAVFGDVGVMIIAVLNAMRILKK